ncbi:MAG: hypothetical protein H0V68_05830 [Actinobacteria bacterium]|nr:hypothetical protein [Actinomycetota bacterium]
MKTKNRAKEAELACSPTVKWLLSCGHTAPMLEQRRDAAATAPDVREVREARSSPPATTSKPSRCPYCPECWEREFGE